MTTTIESAAAVLGVAPDLPMGTPTAAAPPGPACDPAVPDPDGTVWDAALHEDPPRYNAQGRWARRRGNAIRKAKGLPPTGVSAGKAYVAKPAAAPPPPPAAAPPPSASTPPPPELTDGPPVLDAVPDGIAPPPPLDQGQRPLEAYASTAAGLVDGAATVAQLTMGNAWILKADERRGLVDASQRVLHHYQLPVVGPLLELALVLLPIIGRRRNDPETRQVMGNLLAWWRRRGQLAPVVDPYRTMPAAGSSAPAGPPTPNAYRDAPTAPAAPGEKRVVWIP
jgi:hypothetical protein